MNAYDPGVDMFTRVAQQLVDILRGLDDGIRPEWEVLKLQELVNETRGLGNSIFMDTLIPIVEKCYKEYTELPDYPEVSYMKSVGLAVQLVERYALELIGTENVSDVAKTT